jgi:hypothetical protein
MLIIGLFLIPVLIINHVDKKSEEMEFFTCGEALGRHHGHYAPDDWRDEQMWNMCVLAHIKEWPEGYKEEFEIWKKLGHDEKFTRNKIRVLESIIKKKGQEV